MPPIRTIAPLLGLTLGFASLATSPSASATTIVEDFTYSSGVLLGASGGSGWTSSWGASTGATSNTSRILIESTSNLSFALGGYNVAQSGTGLAYGNFNAFRGINRTLAVDLAGTVWFSLLVINGQSDDHAGIEFNNHADSPFSGQDFNVGLFHAELFGSDLEVRYNGTMTNGLATLALGQTHLLLGRLTIGAGNDTFDLWADPADVLNPGTPLFSQSSADLGNNLFLAGVFSYGNADLAATPGAGHGKFDALRISDGDGNATAALQNVVVPEPSAAALLLLSSLGMSSRRRRWKAE